MHVVSVLEQSISLCNKLSADCGTTLDCRTRFTNRDTIHCSSTRKDNLPNHDLCWTLIADL